MESNKLGQRPDRAKIAERRKAFLKLRQLRLLPLGKAVRGQQTLQHHKMTIQSKLAVYAQKAGIPMAEFLDTARWLLDKDCPYCQVATSILRRLEEIGEEKAVDLLTRIQVAKLANDNVALQLIVDEARGVR